jgi:hypothetical protein
MALPGPCPATAGGLVAHQLINHSSRDAGVLQPGGERVAEVMGPMQVDGVQERVAGVGSGDQRQACCSLAGVTRPAAASSSSARWMVASRTGRPFLASRAASCSTVCPPSTRSALRVRMAVGRSSVTGSASLATAAWYVRQKLCRDSTVRVPLLTAAPPPGPVNTRASGSLPEGSWRRIASTTSGPGAPGGCYQPLR